ncbi:MAG: flagellar type III secretion system protein FlhB [Rhodobacteraceae bacterium]|nr:flagellar type III secretion system protein FlhB [Paracoccaceae bacterium]
MSASEQDDSDKSFEPTPQKLKKSREKGDIARSTDLSVFAGYAGLLLALMSTGAASIETFASELMSFLDHPEKLSDSFFDGSGQRPMGRVLSNTSLAIAPFFALPTCAVVLSILAQKGLVFAPDKIRPKLSRISIISNAKNKYGRSGLFEFSKSFVKLVLYSICLGFFLRSKLPDMISVMHSGPGLVLTLLARLCVEFLFFVLVVSGLIGAIDAIWQHGEYLRKNRMSRKEVTDENKDSEGDPHMKQQRRQRGQQIAMSQMMADVPKADVIVVNPTHYAIALGWSRAAGDAPVCLAKGVDEIAAAIRKTAHESGVPIHHDPPTARALYSTVSIGQEIPEDQYRAVAAAIRFAEQMRIRAKGGV